MLLQILADYFIENKVAISNLKTTTLHLYHHQFNSNSLHEIPLVILPSPLVPFLRSISDANTPTALPPLPSPPSSSRHRRPRYDLPLPTPRFRSPSFLVTPPSQLANLISEIPFYGSVHNVLSMFCS